MKSASTALQAHLAQGQTTLAYLWKIKRADGTILGATTHDLDIAYDASDGDGSVTYKALTGFTSSASAAKSDLSVDNSEAMGFINSAAIDEADLRAGLYDSATITIRVVNWNDLTMGDLLVRTGTVGQVKIKNGKYTAEIRGLMYRLTTILGATYGPVCRATFGSGLNGIDMNSQWLCKVDVTAYRQTGSVASVTSPTALVPSSGLLMVGSATPTTAAGAGWFDDGYIKFTSGALNGQSFEIKSWDGTTAKLYLPLPQAPAASDTFIIEPGCNHLLKDCRDKFNNVINRRAEDFIPGPDNYLNYP
ncbi:MAG TPA: DUF2163 domain-containing protein [Candidatus Acidoferrum sp.]|jgi:uncharacterized phage protein (TIGR02218 family)|nr:DUF2163 domain-containing protein [Candidatus Acidoferrum sp.]